MDSPPPPSLPHLPLLPPNPPSLPSPSIPTPTPPPLKAAKRSYQKIDSLRSQLSQALQLTEDGVLLPPFGRLPLSPSDLAHPWAEVVRVHPTLTAVASAEVRREVLGWSDSSHKPPASMSSSFASLLPTLRPSSSFSSSSSSSAPADEERETSWSTSTAYCVAETIGRTSYVGLLQSYLPSLLSLTTNNLHPPLTHLRTRGLLTSAVDRGKGRLWLTNWKARGDASKQVREQRDRAWEDWWTGQTARRRTAMEREHERAPARPYPTGGGEGGEEGGLSLAPALTWGVHPAPQLKLTLSALDQLYRVIAASGTTGATVTDVRDALGGMGMKSYDRLLTTLSGMGVVSLTDRQGKTFTYRLMTKHHYEQLRAQGGVDARAIKQERKEERKRGEEGDSREAALAEVMEVEVAFPSAAPSMRPPLEPQSQPQPEPVPPLPPEPRASTVEEEGSKLSQRAHPLLVFRRRQTTVRMLAEAPDQLLSVLSLNRSLSSLHPPTMTSVTLRAFLSSMADDGLFTIHSFVFPSHTGLQTHTVKVLAARREGLTEEQEEVRRMRAYEVAAVALTEGRIIAASRPRAERREKGEEQEEEKATPEPQEGVAAPAEGVDEKEEASDESDEGQGRVSEKDSLKRTNDTVQSVNRSLLGFIRPLGARAHLLHRLLWTTYQSSDNPVVSADSPSSPLSFRYAQLMLRLTLSDFLLLNGLGVKDINEVGFIHNTALYSLRLDQLPASVQRLIEHKQPRTWPRFKHLYNTLELLRQLHLVEPLLRGQHSAMPSSVLPATVHFEYSLTRSLSVAGSTFDFSSPADLQRYWEYVRRTCIQPVESFDVAGISRDWRISPSLLTQLHHPRRWRHRVTLSREERQQLRDFDEAARASPSSSMLQMEQIRRAARVTNTTPTAVASFYSRIHFPQLSAIHDDIDAHEDSVRANRKENGEEGKEEEKQPREKRPRRSRKEMAEVRAKERDEREARSRAEFARTILPLSADTAELPPLSPLRRRRKRRTAAAGEEEPHPPSETASPPAEPQAGRGRGRAKRVNKLWAQAEDDELVALFNDWLDEQQSAGGLPFTFRPPPHVDMSQDDGFAFAWIPPSSSSLSPFAASFHSLLPLMWLDRPQLPLGPLPLRREVQQEGGAATIAKSGRREQLQRARVEFVLQESPLPAKPVSPDSPLSALPQAAMPALLSSDAATSTQPDAEDVSDGDKAEAEEKREESKAGDGVGAGTARHGQEPRRKLHLDASSALLKPFYAKAASRLERRSEEIVQHRVDTFRTRLSLPMGLSSSTRKRPILSTPYAVAHLSPKAELVALMTLIKVIILQPSVSYQHQLAHQATRHYTDEQVQLVLAVLRSDRWIMPRKLTERGSERAWLLTNAARDLLFGKDREDEESMEEWRKQWSDAPFGHVLQLRAPMEKRQAEALIDDLAQLQLEVLRPDVEEAVEEAKAVGREEVVEEVKEEGKEEAMDTEAALDAGEVERKSVDSQQQEKAAFTKRVDPIDRAAVKVTMVDLHGATISLLSTRWLHTSNTELPAALLHSVQPPSLSTAIEASEHEDEVDLEEVEDEDEQTAAAMEDEGQADDTKEDTLLVHLLPLHDEVDSDAESEAAHVDNDDDDTTALSREVVFALTDAGGAGLSMSELATTLKAEDADLLSDAVQRALRYLQAVRVFSYDHLRFVAAAFASRWCFPEQRSEEGKMREEEWRAVCVAGARRLEEDVVGSGGGMGEHRGVEGVSAVVAHPWRLMGGEVHEELWSSVYRAVLDSIRQWPGLKEERLLSMFPVLTPMEMQHVLGTLLLDDAVVRRSWKQRSRRMEPAEAVQVGEGQGAAEVEEEVTCYFPSPKLTL